MLRFDSKGNLEQGRIHTCSGAEFIDVFCHGETRRDYKSSIVNILDYAKDRGARRIFVGGSFIAQTANPHDFDCVIVFNREADIPSYLDTSIIGDVEFDILYASEDNPGIIDSYLCLFQTYRNGLGGKPVVEILLDDRIKEWEIVFQPSDDDMEIVRKVYCHRSVIERRKARGLLVTIHGVNTKAFWNSKFGPLASSQGWIFAPFIYDNPKRLLVCPSKRRKVVESFGEYLYDLGKRYGTHNCSIVAHSFGTYIVAKYLLDHDFEKFLPMQIDSVVLTGSIVDADYDWEKYFPAKLARVMNISSRNDGAVKFMPSQKLIKRYIMGERDGIFGKSGYSGVEPLTDHPEFIIDKKVNMLGHCNVFKDEILEGVIMPFLNANNGIGNIEFIEALRNGLTDF